MSTQDVDAKHGILNLGAKVCDAVGARAGLALSIILLFCLIRRFKPPRVRGLEGLATCNAPTLHRVSRTDDGPGAIVPSCRTAEARGMHRCVHTWRRHRGIRATKCSVFLLAVIVGMSIILAGESRALQIVRTAATFRNI